MKLLLLATFLVLGFNGRSSIAASQHGKRVVGYFTEWNAEFDVDKLRAELLTHVIYAFAVIKDGEVAISNPEHATQKAYAGDPSDAPFRGRFRQLQLLKKKHPHLHTLISVGGWGGSAGFSDAAMTDSSRRRFALSCAAFVNKYGFDGIDIDWEFPVTGGGRKGIGRPEDSRNFTLLLESIRRAVDEQGARDGKRYLLTFAAPAGPHNYKHIELDRVHAHVDWINLMTYDFAGTWSKVTCFNAPLYTPDTGIEGVTQLSSDATVRAYRTAGVPADKIVVGVPFYCRAFGSVRDLNHGLFQPHDGKPPATPAGARHWTYGSIIASGLDQSAQRHWHDRAKVPWIYDARAGVLITYEDPDSVRAKAAYVRDHGLGGVMIWELSQDDARASLLEALSTTLRAR
jgi:chitinase